MGARVGLAGDPAGFLAAQNGYPPGIMAAPDGSLDGRGNRLLAALPDTDRERLLADAEPLEMTVRQPIYEPGKPIEQVYFPIDAVLSVLAVMDDGQAVEVATVGNEGMVGIPVFLGVSTSPGLAFCQVPGRSWRMPAGTFRELANGAGAFHGLLQRYTFAFFTQISQGSACNRLHHMDQRLARWLLLTHDRIGQDQFPLTQEFMAQMLGVRRATVTEAARRLQQDGLITYSRGVITVTDRKGLEAASCECYRIISDEHARLIG
jgi:CRP-like cAMP-binding protein